MLINKRFFVAVQVVVHGGNIEKAMRELKKGGQRELVHRVLKRKRFYESPSEKRVRKMKETAVRIKKNNRKRRREF